jgi:putative endonuclease
LDTCLPAGREQQPISERQNMYFVYILRSEKVCTSYTGFTNNLDRRLKEHNSGKTKSTKHNKPWKLLFFETFENRIEARLREKYLKSGIGREYIKNRPGSSVG